MHPIKKERKNVFWLENGIKYFAFMVCQKQQSNMSLGFKILFIIISNCRYICNIMHCGPHISWRWSSKCIWTSCQAPQFFSWCNPRNIVHMWGQNHRRILCWPWSWLSTLSCLCSSLGIWGKRILINTFNIIEFVIIIHVLQTQEYWLIIALNFINTNLG